MLCEKDLPFFLPLVFPVYTRNIGKINLNFNYVDIQEKSLNLLLDNYFLIASNGSLIFLDIYTI